MLRYVPSIPTLRDFLSWMIVKFCEVLFLHLWRWSCSFSFLLTWYITLIVILNHPCGLRVNPTYGIWSFLYITKSVHYYFVEDFCIYINQRYWLVIFFFGSVLVWFWYHGDDGLTLNLGVFCPLEFFGILWKA